VLLVRPGVWSWFTFQSLCRPGCYGGLRIESGRGLRWRRRRCAARHAWAAGPSSRPAGGPSHCPPRWGDRSRGPTTFTAAVAHRPGANLKPGRGRRRCFKPRKVALRGGWPRVSIQSSARMTDRTVGQDGRRLRPRSPHGPPTCLRATAPAGQRSRSSSCPQCPAAADHPRPVTAESGRLTSSTRHRRGQRV